MTDMTQGLTYLASPYSDPSPEVEHARFLEACKHAAQMMAQGILVFSPIAHSHPIALAGDLPRGWDFWERPCMAMLGPSERLVVLMLDGWRESVGVTAEIKNMIDAGKQVMYRNPDQTE